MRGESMQHENHDLSDEQTSPQVAGSHDHRWKRVALHEHVSPLRKVSSPIYKTK